MKSNINLTLLLIISILNLSGQSKDLSYNQFINIIKEQNPHYQTSKNLSSIGAHVQKSAQGNYDPVIQSKIENKFFSGKNYYINQNTEIKQALYTSQYLKIGYEYGQGIYNGNDKNTPITGLPYVGIEADILQGLLFDKRRAEIIKSNHYKTFYEKEGENQMNEVLLLASNAYFDYLCTQKINTLLKQFLNISLQRFLAIKELAAAGEKPSMDTVEAAIFYQTRELEWLYNLQELNKKSNDIQQWLNEPFDTLSTVKEEIKSYFQSAQNQKQIPTDLNLHPQIGSYLAKQKITETELRLKKELIKPKLSVSYNFLSHSHPDIPINFSTSNYKWSANFSFPLFFRQSYHQYKISQLEVSNIQFEKQNKYNQLNSKQNATLSNIQLLEEQIRITEKSTELNKILVQAEKLKFDAGESSLFLLNARETKWLETEIKLAEYYFKYLQLHLQLTYLNGQLNYSL